MTEHLTLEDMLASGKRVITGHEDFEYEPINAMCVYFVPVRGECDCVPAPLAGPAGPQGAVGYGVREGGEGRAEHPLAQ